MVSINDADNGKTCQWMSDAWWEASQHTDWVTCIWSIQIGFYVINSLNFPNVHVWHLKTKQKLIHHLNGLLWSIAKLSKCVYVCVCMGVLLPWRQTIRNSRMKQWVECQFSFQVHFWKGGTWGSNVRNWLQRLRIRTPTAGHHLYELLS